MKKLLSILLLIGILDIVSVHAFGGGGPLGDMLKATQGAIQKSDACNNTTIADGLHDRILSIDNYPGYAVRIGNFYKEEGKLYYVVDAKNINTREREAFLWSWDCKIKKPRQISKYDFSKFKDYESGDGLQYSSVSESTIGIEFADKYHIFIDKDIKVKMGFLKISILSSIDQIKW